jgi:hypothetical protein
MGLVFGHTVSFGIAKMSDTGHANCDTSARRNSDHYTTETVRIFRLVFRILDDGQSPKTQYF